MFSKINFKYTDAGEEKLHAPELIEKAFVDINEVIEQVNSPEIYLVIGPKGSGKTALSTKLDLLSKSLWNLFVENDELEEFQFKLLDKTGADKGDLIGGAITTWQMLLAIRMIPLLLQDEQIKMHNENLVRFIDGLKKYGLSSSESLISIVQYTSRRGVYGQIKSILAEIKGGKSEEEQQKLKDPAGILEAINLVLKRITPSDSKYFLVLDGLDHPLRKGRSNAPYIGDLINAVRLLNTFFSKIKLNAKIIILIRDEVLRIVPDPNLAKRINDNGVFLKWYDNTRAPLETALLEVIENRAKLVGYNSSIKDLWKSWFPEKIKNRNSYTFILDNTRHLPRDVISFFRELQKLKKEPPFNKDDVLAALNNYSDWFLTELSDALVGLVDENIRIALPGILQKIGRRFSFQAFESELAKHIPKSTEFAEQIAREMFNASWICNVWETDMNTYRYSWKHRKQTANFDSGRMIGVHPGLWKALNLV